MKKIKVEYFVKYDWYGYEGVGYQRGCEYISDDILKVHRFITDEQFRREEMSWHNNGFFEKIGLDIYKRTIVDEIIDYKQESRDKKIKQIMK